MNERLQRAIKFCEDAHRSIGQVRKYSGEPYENHPKQVVQILINAGETDEDVLVAAYLHDVLEDVYPKNPAFGPSAIREQFGEKVLELVKELTDVFIKTNYPTMNRVDRKNNEAVRLSSISMGAMKAKMADLIANCGDIVRQDPGFAVRYLAEKNVILGYFKGRPMDAVAKRLYVTISAQIAHP